MNYYYCCYYCGCECGSTLYLLKLRAEMRVDLPLELLGGLPVHLERRAIDLDADESDRRPFPVARRARGSDRELLAPVADADPEDRHGLAAAVLLHLHQLEHADERLHGEAHPAIIELQQ